MAGRLTSSTASERRRLWDVSEVSWTCPGHDQLHQRTTAPLPPAQSLAEDVADDGVAARLEADEPQRLLLECARLLGAGAVACAMGVVVSSGTERGDRDAAFELGARRGRSGRRIAATLQR